MPARAVCPGMRCPACASGFRWRWTRPPDRMAAWGWKAGAISLRSARLPADASQVRTGYLCVSSFSSVGEADTTEVKNRLRRAIFGPVTGRKAGGFSRSEPARRRSPAPACGIDTRAAARRGNRFHSAGDSTICRAPAWERRYRAARFPPNGRAGKDRRTWLPRVAAPVGPHRPAVSYSSSSSAKKASINRAEGRSKRFNATSAARVQPGSSSILSDSLEYAKKERATSSLELPARVLPGWRRELTPVSRWRRPAWPRPRVSACRLSHARAAHRALDISPRWKHGGWRRWWDLRACAAFDRRSRARRPPGLDARRTVVSVFARHWRGRSTAPNWSNRWWRRRDWRRCGLPPKADWEVSPVERPATAASLRPLKWAAHCRPQRMSSKSFPAARCAGLRR